MSALRAAKKTAENSVKITDQLPQQIDDVQACFYIITACTVAVSSMVIIALLVYVGNSLHAKS